MGGKGAQVVTEYSLSEGQLRAASTMKAALPEDAYIGGGAALAHRYGHRRSLDMDVFTQKQDPSEVIDDLCSQPGVVITSQAKNTVYLEVDAVPVSIIRYRYDLLAPLESRTDIALPLASEVDLACMKMAAISQRGYARDFWDLYEVLRRTQSGLSEVLGAYQKKYPAQDIGHVVRSLVYFGDAEEVPLPVELSTTRWQSICNYFEQEVPKLGS